MPSLATHNHSSATLSHVFPVIFFYLAIVVYSYGMYVEEGATEDLMFYIIARHQLRNPYSGQPQQQHNPYSGQPQPELGPQTPQSQTVQNAWFG